MTISLHRDDYAVTMSSCLEMEPGMIFPIESAEDIVAREKEEVYAQPNRSLAHRQMNTRAKIQKVEDMKLLSKYAFGRENL